MFDTKSRIHISAGLPRVSILPFSKVIEQIIYDLKNEQNPEILQYGFASGYERFRKILADFIGEKEGRVVNPRHLFVTNGATHGILLSIIALSGKKKASIIERPTYFPLIDLFRELNLDLYFVDVDEHGISTEGIKQILSKARTDKVFIHCTPYFQNPTRFNVSAPRMHKLLNIVEHNNKIWPLLDNVYKYLSFSQSPISSLFDFSLRRVIKVNSFSKIFGPGLRIGWIETDELTIGKIEESGYVQSSGGFNPFICRSLERIILSGFINDIINKWITFLANKQSDLVRDLQSIFPEAEYTRPDGGYYLWVNFKNHLLSNSTFREFVKNKMNVVYVPGTKCAGSPNLYQTYTRLGFATYKNDELTQGLSRLKVAFNEFTK